MSEIPRMKKRSKVEDSEEKSGGGEGLKELVERVSQRQDPYAKWRNPILEDVPALREELKRFVWALHPLLLLSNVDAILERIRTDNRLLMDELWVKSGGWGRVKKDMKKAERWILELYGLE